MGSFFDKLFKSKPATPASPSHPAEEATAEVVQRQFEEIYSRATQAMASQNFDSALGLYEQAIALNPAHAEAFYKRGNALRILGRLAAAVDSYDRAIELQPNYAYAYCNRGTVQRTLGLLDAAELSFDRAIVLAPADAVAHYNRALLMQDFFRWSEARASYDAAIALNPEYAEAQYNRAMLSLYLGDFESGWLGFEWRWASARQLNIGAARQFAQPLWLGEEPLAGKRLFIHSEQGLGDTIQFGRYAALCAAQGATVILEVQQPLLKLLTRLQGPAQLTVKDTPPPSFDYHCPIMSLPLAFNTTIDSIPGASSYLQADASRVAQWQPLLGNRTKPRVGLAWSGNPHNPIDLRRSITLADWIPHLPQQFDYFCVQKDLREADLAALEPSDIFSFADELVDFEDTAALCQCMDIVVTVDTSVLHLCGALGKRTWALLPYVPDWRWMRDREDTPWYPAVKLYRQTTPGDWVSVFTRIAADLGRELK